MDMKFDTNIKDNAANQYEIITRFHNPREV